MVKAKILFFSALALSFLGALLLFIKLNYFFWESKGDILIYSGFGMIILAMLFSFIAFGITTKSVIQTSKINWVWYANTILALVHLISLIYFFTGKY